VFTAIVCTVALLASFLGGAAFSETSAQSNKSLHFVTEALGFSSPKYLVQGGSESAYASYINDTYVVMNVTGYTVESEAGNLTVSCAFPSQSQSPWFVTLTISRSSAELPVFAQLSADVVDRARDFLTKYGDWTGNMSLNDVIDMLDKADVADNMTATTNQLNMTITSSSQFVSFYWEYVLNGTGYRGFGLTFAGKYVFFRDDRNLPFPPRAPPATIFTSFSPYGLGIDFPDEGAVNVPLDTNFTVMTTRPAGIVDLYLNPEAKIEALQSETRNWSGYYTFLLAEPLQPKTMYTAILIYGQSIPADFDSAPLSIKSWSFKTGDSSATPIPTISPDPTANSSPSPTVAESSPSLEISVPSSPFPMAIVYVVMAAASVAVVGLVFLLLKKKKPPRL